MEAAGILGGPLKWATNLLRLLFSELQCLGSSSKGDKDIGGWIYGFGLKVGGISLSQTEVPAKVIVLLLSCQAGMVAESSPTWLTLLLLPWWFPVSLSHSTLGSYLNRFQSLSHTNSLSWLMLQTFPKICQRFTNPQQVNLASGSALEAASLDSHSPVPWNSTPGTSSSHLQIIL